MIDFKLEERVWSQLNEGDTLLYQEADNCQEHRCIKKIKVGKNEFVVHLRNLLTLENFSKKVSFNDICYLIKNCAYRKLITENQLENWSMA